MPRLVSRFYNLHELTTRTPIQITGVYALLQVVTDINSTDGAGMIDGTALTAYHTLAVDNGGSEHRMYRWEWPVVLLNGSAVNYDQLLNWQAGSQAIYAQLLQVYLEP